MTHHFYGSIAALLMEGWHNTYICGLVPLFYFIALQLAKESYTVWQTSALRKIGLEITITCNNKICICMSWCNGNERINEILQALDFVQSSNKQDVFRQCRFVWCEFIVKGMFYKLTF